MENGLFCGNERRKRSMVALMDFMDEVISAILAFFLADVQRLKIRNLFMFSTSKKVLHQLMLLYALWFQEYLCCAIRDSLD